MFVLWIIMWFSSKYHPVNTATRQTQRIMHACLWVNVLSLTAAGRWGGGLALWHHSALLVSWRLRFQQCGNWLAASLCLNNVVLSRGGCIGMWMWSRRDGCKSDFRTDEDQSKMNLQTFPARSSLAAVPPLLCNLKHCTCCILHGFRDVDPSLCFRIPSRQNMNLSSTDYMYYLNKPNEIQPKLYYMCRANCPTCSFAQLRWLTW